MLTKALKDVFRAQLGCGVSDPVEFTMPTGSSFNTSNWYSANSWEWNPAYQAMYSSPQTTSNPSYSTNNTYGVWFGNGTSAPTENDYKLSGSPVTAFSYTRVKYFGKDDVGEFSAATFTITASENITITEIGVFCRYWYEASQARSFLADHILLDTPLSLAAGEVGQITYKFYHNLDL